MNENLPNYMRYLKNTSVIALSAIIVLVSIFIFIFFRFQQYIIRPVKGLPLNNPIIYENITGEVFASGDFNNDNKGDLATISSGALKVYLGTGASAFSAPLSLNVGISNLNDLKTADINNDGNFDLIVAAQGNTTMAIFLGAGDGTFTAGSGVNIGLVTKSITLADINNDNNVDLLYLADNTAKFYSRLGNGAGAFQAATEYTGVSNQKSITSADFNNDSYADVAIIGNSVQIFINDDNGGFIEGANYIQSGSKIIAADITNDNFVDLVFVGSKVVTLINKGNASFILGEIYDGSSSVYITGTSLFTGDYNNDGENDVGVIFSNKLYLYYNQSVLYITYLSPPGVFVGESAFTLTVNGSGFNSNSIVRFNGNNKTTVYINPNQIEATIAAGDVSETSTNDVTVYDSSSGVESVMRFFYVIPGFFDAQNFSTGTQPTSLYTANLNGDSFPDLAVANSGSNNISIKLGRGDGMFIPANPETIAVNNQPNSIAGGDFNGDTYIDLVVANKGSDNLSVLMGNGLGGFTAATAITAGSQPEKVIVTDFNNDDNLDLAVACSGSNNIKVFLGNGLGGFAQSEADAVGTQPRSLASADFNKDGFKDLAVANYGSTSISILLGNGNGTFMAADPATITTGLQPISVADADFNGDNFPDLIVANYGENTVKIFLGDGEGHFAESAELNTDIQPRVVSTQDFNGDDIDDYAVVNYGANNMIMVLGNGDGTFYSAINYDLGTQPLGIINGDFNNDSRIDFAVANNGSNNISIILKRKIIDINILKPENRYNVNLWPKGLVSGDIDGDGYKDLMVVNEGPNTVSLLHNDRDGTFTALSEFDVADRPIGVDSADLNADGREDMVVTTGNSANYSVFLGKPDGTLPNVKNYNLPTYPNGFTAGDFNGDSIYDVAVSLQPTAEIGQIGVFLGNGDTSFTAGDTYTVGRWPSGVTSGDFNNDNILDVAVFNSYIGNISVLLGNGDGTFQAPQDFDLGADPATGDNAVISIDINNDNNLDIIVSRFWHGGGDPNYNRCLSYNCYTAHPYPICATLTCPVLSGDGIFILLGDGDGTFQNYQGYGDLINSHFVIAAKINNDNYYDLITSKVDDNQLVVLFNNTTGGFDSEDIVTYDFTNPYPAIAASGDLDNDGDNDLAVATALENKLYIMMNDGSGSLTTNEVKSIDISPSNLRIIDFNNDGFEDIVISTQNATNEVPVYLNNGDGTFSNPVNYSGAADTMSMEFFDNNNDDIVDIISLSNSKQLVSTLVSNGDGTFDTPRIFGGADGPISHVLHDDFNNDGNLDLLVGPRVEFGDGTGQFSSAVDSVEGMSFYSNTSGDFDEDGDIDLAGLDWPGMDRMAVSFNDGNGNFGSPTYYSVSSLPWDIISADFNNDGHLDLAVASQYAAQISMFMGNGTGYFSNAVPANLYYSVQSLINEDFNGDGREDLVVLNSPNYLSILLGNDNLTFQPPVDYNVGSGPYQVITDDFNNDQRPDLASTNTDLSNISVFLGDVITAPQIYHPGVGVIGTPSKPVEFDCQALSGQTIRWSFDNISADAIGFNLYATDGLIYSTEGEDITDLNYIDESDLEPNTLYEDRFVRIFNNNGESPASNDASCYTLVNEPLPLIINITPAEFRIIIDSSDGNPEGTDYAIYEYYSDSYLHADGKLYKDEPQWRVYSGWGGSSGIKVNETLAVYDFYPLARNVDGIISGFRPHGLSLSCKAISSTEIDWQLKTPSSWDKDGFDFYRVQPDEASFLADEIVNQSTDVTYQDKELTPNTAYSAFFKTFKDSEDVKTESEASNTDNCYTLANEPLPLKIVVVSDASVQITLDSRDGNPPETLYAIYDVKSGLYVQVDHSLGSEPVWQTYAEWGGEEGFLVNVVSGSEVTGQFHISLDGVDLSQYDFVAKVKNGDGIVTSEPEVTSVSVSKGVAVNAVLSANTLPGKIALAGNGLPSQSLALRLIQEFSFFLNLILIILIIVLAINLYSTFKHLNLTRRLMEKFRYLLLIFNKEPAVIFSRWATKDKNGTYQLSYYRQRIAHLSSQKALRGAAGIVILKVVILVALTFGLAGLQYQSIAQVIDYNQDQSEVNVGDKVSYIIRFYNTGDVEARNIVVLDNLDANLSFVADSYRAIINGVEIIPKFTIDGSLLKFNLENLGAKQNGNITFDAVVNSVISGGDTVNISNVAVVSGENFGTRTTNTVSNSVAPEVMMIEETPLELLDTETDQKDTLAEVPAVVSGGGSGNLPPQAVADNAETFTDQDVEIAVLNNDSDPENQLDIASLAVIIPPQNGMASIDSEQGTIIYHSNPGFVGEDSFRYQICDQGNQCAQAPVSVTVKAVEVAGQEVKISILGSIFRAVTADVSKTNMGEQAFASIMENETVKKIIESAPVQFAQDKVLNNPAVEQASQNLVTPTLVTVSVINTAPAIVSAGMNFWAYLHFIFIEPLLILFRKKRKNWGVVYDSLTKMPISLAMVRLYRKEDRRLIQTKVTDREGRYLIMVKDPGNYYLEVTKPNYDFPTKILSTEKMDTKYIDLYHGEEVAIKDKEAAVSVNIPLDVREKKVRPIRAVIRSFALQHLKTVISYVGLILAILVLIIYPSVITILALVFHVVFYIIFRKLLIPTKPKGWGIIYDEQTKQALHNVVVRLFDLKFNKLLETQLTDSQGRYAFLVGQNVFQVMAEKDGYQTKEIKPVDLSANDQIVNLDIALAKHSQSGIITANTDQPVNSDQSIKNDQPINNNQLTNNELQNNDQSTQN